MSRPAIYAALSLALSACDQACPEGTYQQGKHCVPGERTAANEASVAEEAPDAAGARAEERPSREQDAGPRSSGDAGPADASARDEPARAGAGGTAEPARAGASGPAEPARDEPARAGAPAATGGAGAPAEEEPEPAPPEPGVGRSLLFWGSAAVTYPFTGDALISTERLREGKYRVTGKLGMRNPAEVALDVTCSVKLDQAINIERVSVPPAGSVSLFLIAVGATGATNELQHAALTCACDSGDACTGLIFESLGIVTTIVAADSGTVQKPSPAVD